MEYHISSEMLYTAACLIYIFSGIFCGMIRWLHMCKPYDENGDYFYPGRKQLTFFFFAIILQFPYLLNPMDADTWTYIRAFGILYYPLCFSMLFKRYFRRERLNPNNGKGVYYAIPFVIISLMLAFVLFHEGTVLTEAGCWLMGAMGGLSILFTIGYFQEARRIKRCIKVLNEEEYSNEDDFPYIFAKKVYYSPLIWMVPMWLIFITGSHWIKFVVDIFLAFWMVHFLTVILHPQQFFSNATQKEKQDRMKEKIGDIVKEFVSYKPEQPHVYDADKESGKKDETFECDNEVRKEVLAVMLRKFKNPHLQKSEVLNEISLGNKMEANRFIVHVKYYILVNMFRLEYARQYAKANPKATIDKVALASGFSSRYALNNAKKKVPRIDPALTEGVTLDC